MFTAQAHQETTHIDSKKTSFQFQEIASKDNNDTLAESGWVLKNITSKPESHGITIRILDKNNSILAMCEIVPAEQSQFKEITKAPDDALNNTIFISSIWLEPSLKSDSNLLATVLYFVLRRARILGKQNVVTLTTDPNAFFTNIIRLEPLSNLKKLEYNGKVLTPLAQRLKYSILHAYRQTYDEYQTLIQNNMVDEILETLHIWLKKFYNGSWSTSIINGTIAKEQYICSLFNLHQYVRQTTRLCARCIALSDNDVIKDHYIYHLRGEINHEIMIERDLKYLGADVAYLKTHHVPHPATKEFMVVQESTIAFYQDPLIFFACPLSAEGVTAYMRQDFMDALYRVIKSWGVGKPKEAARFLSSHMNTDGGDDGHFVHVVNTLKKFIKSETLLQRFLSVQHAAMNGFLRGFDANIDDLQLWSIKEAH